MSKYSKGDRFILDGGKIEGEVSAVNVLDQKGNYFVHFDGSPIGNILEVGWLEAHSEPLKATPEEQFAALRIGAHFHYLNSEGNDGVRVKLSETQYARLAYGPTSDAAVYAARHLAGDIEEVP